MADTAHGNGITLREFFERLLDDHMRAHGEHQLAHDREHNASQRAIDTASELARVAKADANEWRAAMTDRERTFARADAMDRIDAETDRRLKALEKAVAASEGVAQGTNQTREWFAPNGPALISLGLAALALYLALTR